jgi:hypothetical protein
VAVTEESGRVLEVGRRTRTVSKALKRSLFSRDRGCTFPGCHHTRFLDAHHVQHWADGGETSLANLLTLCATHHRLVHEGGFAIQRNREGDYYFTRPDGRPVELTRPGATDQVEDGCGVYRVRFDSAEADNAGWPRRAALRRPSLLRPATSARAIGLPTGARSRQHS